MTDKLTLHHGDCLEVLRLLPDCSVDSIVTDPPYGLSFMGKRWDYDVPSVEVWAECLRVLKPGGHLLAFAGTRTQHRMAVRIEDAGFEIRDMIAWVYGSGFPKSLDVSKAIDRMRDDSVEATAIACFLLKHTGGRRLSEFREYLNANIVGESHSGGSAQGWTTANCDGVVKARVPTWEQWERIKTLLQLPDDMDAEVWRLNGRKGKPGENWGKREVLGTKTQNMTEASTWATESGSGMFRVGEKTWDITAPATPEAKQWEGWGTALKPALEPITVARKPLMGTVAENVLQHGTGAINVDGGRVGTEERITNWSGTANYKVSDPKTGTTTATGRWPANFIHDGSEEATDLLGASARFFYCAKASKADRDENHHPTVKPTDLMRYLCRLVTPPSGIVLDPFMGSGSTGKAAMLEGFAFVGIEREAEYIDIAKARIQSAVGLL